MTVPGNAVRAQLQRILQSGQFKSSELQQRFLSFVVEKTLDGSADGIKEYAIGAEAFGRGQDFDPRLDSVVRVVARRVRDRLAEYYRSEGRDDPVLIVLEKGSYVPSFEPHRKKETPVIAPADGASSAQPVEAGEKARVPTKADRRRGRMEWWIAAGLTALAALIVAIYFLIRPGPAPRILKYAQLTDDGQGKLGAFAVGTPAPLVTDGARIYFTEVSGSQVVLRQVPAAGGQTAPLMRELKNPLVVMDISPDHTELLATEFFRAIPDAPLQILPLPDGEAHPVGSLVGHDGAWSPDGEQICYADENHLYIARKDGADSKVVATLPGVASWPRWSPDGSRVRFTVQDASDNTALWEVSASGGDARPILAGWNEHPAECCGSWTPDGQYFVFQSTRQGRTGLWAFRERTWSLGTPASPTELTQGPVNVWAPAFNRDGSKVFAVVQQRRGELVRWDPTLQRFVSYLSGISADHVEFSRDGQWVAYARFPEQTIWRSRADGSERLQLSSAPMLAIFPRWSPNGSRIAFMGSLPGKPVRIYLVPANGGAPEPMLPGDSPQIDPNWSPDGNSIMFAALPGGTDIDAGQPVIQILDLKNHQLSTLPGSRGLSAPRWSPDGRFVMATAISQGRWADPAVRIFDFKTGQWSGLEKDPIDNKWWSADGEYFYFDKLMTDDPAIYRIRMRDRQIERVASLKSVRRAFGEMGWWMGLTPDGSPMVLRDASIEEIYALDFKGR